MWVVPREQLTEDQLAAVTMSHDRHRVIVGGPGSGKTLVLAHRARALLDSGMSPDRVHVFVYTNVLKDYLHEGLDELGLVPSRDSATGTDIVTTFDSWCLQSFDSLVTGRRPRTPDGKGVDYDAVRAAVLARYETSELPPTFDAVLVDEGQDLTETAVKLLRRIAVHVTLAMDSRQQLYPDGTDTSTVCELLGVQRATASLLSAYRCTPLVVDLAAEFLPSDKEAAAFRAANLMPLSGIETPVLQVAADADGEMSALATALAERAMLGHSCAVLLPTGWQVNSVHGALGRRNVQCVKREKGVPLQMVEGRPLVLTYHSAKGLTVDAVFLPTLTEKTFSGFTDSEQRQRMLFVGLTRATRWVWMGTRVSDRLPELERLAPLLRRKTVLQLETAPTGTTPSAVAASGNASDVQLVEGTPLPPPHKDARAVKAAAVKRAASPPKPTGNLADLL